MGAIGLNGLEFLDAVNVVVTTLYLKQVCADARMLKIHPSQYCHEIWPSIWGELSERLEHGWKTGPNPARLLFWEPLRELRHERPEVVLGVGCLEVAAFFATTE